MKFPIYILLCGSLSLAGCAGSPKIMENAQFPVLQNQALPAPTDTAWAAALRPYTVGPGDKLSISVLSVEELNLEDIVVDAEGNFAFPFVGTIKAAGETPQQIAAIITDGLRGRFVKNPYVAVNLKEAVSQDFAINGAVNQPGIYQVRGNMTLMRAVAAAGGVADYAKLDDVVVFRTVGEQRMAGLYNLKAIRAGAYSDPEIYPSDIVVIGDSAERRQFERLLQIAAPLITTPLVVLIRGF